MDFKEFMNLEEFLEMKDTRHNPEFTSVEIYEAFADYFDMMELTEKLLSSVCEKICGQFVKRFVDLRKLTIKNKK